MTDRQTDRQTDRHRMTAQTCPWVRFIHGLGWVGFEIFAYERVGLGLVARK